MNNYDNEKRIVLFPKDTTSEKQPTLTGTLSVDGVQYKVALWDKSTKNGTRFYSGKITVDTYNRPIDDNVSQPVKVRPKPKAADEDEIPF